MLTVCFSHWVSADGNNSQGVSHSTVELVVIRREHAIKNYLYSRILCHVWMHHSKHSILTILLTPKQPNCDTGSAKMITGLCKPEAFRKIWASTVVCGSWAIITQALHFWAHLVLLNGADQWVTMMTHQLCTTRRQMLNTDRIRHNGEWSCPANTEEETFSKGESLPHQAWDHADHGSSTGTFKTFLLISNYSHALSI